MDDARRMSNSAWVASSRLMSGLILYTGLGWLLSRWVGHQELLMAVGALVGLALSYYLIFAGLKREAAEDEERVRGQASVSAGMEDPGVD